MNRKGIRLGAVLAILALVGWILWFAFFTKVNAPLSPAEQTSAMREIPSAFFRAEEGPRLLERIALQPENSGEAGESEDEEENRAGVGKGVLQVRVTLAETGEPVQYAHVRLEPVTEENEPFDLFWEALEAQNWEWENRLEDLEEGAALEYCGYIEGYLPFPGFGIRARDIAVDERGRAYVVGQTPSDERSFPVTYGPDLTFNGDYDGYIARISPAGKELDFCGYFGGECSDYCYAVALDAYGAVYLTGVTTSIEAMLPVAVGPDLTFNGMNDAFVAKITFALSSDATTLSVQGGTVNFQLHGGVANRERLYLLLGSMSGTEPGLPLPGGLSTLPLNWDAFTDLVLARLNSPVFSDFLGELNDYGTGSAALNAPSLNPSKIGMTVHLAFLLEGEPWDFVSDPLALGFVP